MVAKACRIAYQEGFALPGQRIIISAGVPLGTPGATNMLRIAFVGDETEDFLEKPASSQGRSANSRAATAVEWLRHRAACVDGFIPDKHNHFLDVVAHLLHGKGRS